MIPDVVQLEKAAKMLGVDEVRVARDPGDLTVSIAVRIRSAWLATAIKTSVILDAKDRPETIGRALFELADALKLKMGANATFIDTASGEDLDRAAGLVGVQRKPEQPRRRLTRFEAIVEELAVAEELKKL